MKLILFGATGMVGTGVLREALADPEVEKVLSVSRRSCGENHPKLQELLLPDLFNFTAVESQLKGYDACIWALGISSVGMDEASYSKIMEELTLLWAKALLRINPRFSFCYCCGKGADGTAMWARVRQRVEAGIKALPFKYSGSVRPGFIKPGPGIKSRVKFYNFFITVFKPLFPILMAFPKLATTSERLAKTMLLVVKGKTSGFIIESEEINKLGAA